MIRLLLILAAAWTAVCVTEPTSDELIADIFGTELSDNELDLPPSGCASLEGSGAGCYECYLCNDTRIIEYKSKGRQTSELLQSRGDCGKSNPGGKPRKRRVSLRSVLQGEFPWRAWVYKKNSETPLCAATFVHEDTKALLTLASCVHGMAANSVEVAFVRGGQRSAVKKVITHGSYRAGDDVNNIALLQLRSLDATPAWAAPACLPAASPAHAAPCLTASAQDVLLNTVIPLRRACYENKTDPPAELTCATAPLNDYDAETAAGLYCKEQHVTRPAYILNGIAIKRLDDAVSSYVNVWHFAGWISEKLGIPA